MREAANGLQKTSLKPVKTMEGFKRKTKQYILTLTYFFETINVRASCKMSTKTIPMMKAGTLGW